MLSETIANTTGIFDCGVLVSVFLFGVATAQTFTYYRNFPRDSKTLKIFVAVVFFFELAHATHSSHLLYWLSVNNEGIVLKSTDPINPLQNLCVVSILSAINTFIIQGFFAYRMHVILHCRVTPVLCVLLALGHLIGLSALSLKGYQAHSLLAWREQALIPMIVVLSASTAADIITAVTLCLVLWRRHKEIRSPAHKVVDKIIAWSLETCLLTSFGMVVMLILFVTMDNFAWMAVLVIITRLYSNSFLALLNGRKGLRNRASDTPTFLDLGTSANELHDIELGNLDTESEKDTLTTSSHLPPLFPQETVKHIINTPSDLTEIPKQIHPRRNDEALRVHFTQ